MNRFGRTRAFARFALACRRGFLAATCAVAGAVVSAVIFNPVSGARAAFARPAAADLWPTFGHDPLHSGVSSDSAITASTAPELSKRWSASLSSTIDEPSPVVAYSAKLHKTVVY